MMETLTSVLRAMRAEPKERRDHLAVFRAFLDHLDRVSRRNAPRRRATRAKPNGRRNGKG